MNEPKCPANTINILLSLATTPMLFGLVMIKSLSQTVIEIGQGSEELFRGDRLPLLKVSPEVSDL